MQVSNHLHCKLALLQKAPYNWPFKLSSVCALSNVFLIDSSLDRFCCLIDLLTWRNDRSRLKVARRHIAYNVRCKLNISETMPSRRPGVTRWIRGDNCSPVQRITFITTTFRHSSFRPQSSFTGWTKFRMCRRPSWTCHNWWYLTSSELCFWLRAESSRSRAILGKVQTIVRGCFGAKFVMSRRFSNS